MVRAIVALVMVISSAEASTKKQYVQCAPPNSSVLKPDLRVETHLKCLVEKGFHVQANPATLPQLIPTRLGFASKKGINVSVTYPDGKPYTQQGLAQPIQTYEGEFILKVLVSATGEASKGSTKLKGILKYQACDDKICFFPMDLPVELPLKVEK